MAEINSIDINTNLFTHKARRKISQITSETFPIGDKK